MSVDFDYWPFSSFWSNRPLSHDLNRIHFNLQMNGSLNFLEWKVIDYRLHRFHLFDLYRLVADRHRRLHLADLPRRRQQLLHHRVFHAELRELIVLPGHPLVSGSVLDTDAAMRAGCAELELGP